MPTLSMSFLSDLSWLDAVDIFLVAFLFYQFYNLIKGTVAINIFMGVLSVYAIYLLVRLLKLELLESIIGQFIGVGVIALVVVFQQEIRRFLIVLGTRGFVGEQGILKTIIDMRNSKLNVRKTDAAVVLKAILNMSGQHMGAIIVVQVSNNLDFFAATGERLDAVLSSRLLESIFYKNSPLHDGAVIINRNRIIAARCVLPVSENENFPGNLGMRHRAALGVSETTDALVIVVSEQSGEIALAHKGNLQLHVDKDALKLQIEAVLEAD